MLPDPDLIQARITPVLESFGVDFAYLGGSVARGTAGWWSDIDIFVHKESLKNASKTEKWDWFQKLDLELVRVLETDKVDLNIIDDLPLHVQFSAISDGIPVYENVSENGSHIAHYIEWLLPLYYDHIIWYRRMINERINS